MFREHIATVRAEIAAERLLVFDVREGWAPLCAFLGVPIPDMPYPKTNSSKEFKDEEWKKELRRQRPSVLLRPFRSGHREDLAHAGILVVAQPGDRIEA